jgi:hypothetical protein
MQSPLNAPLPRPGRTCPIAYHYGAASLNRDANLAAQTIYVIGGLYGNSIALEALLRMTKLEPDAKLVFNGDFNWFNIDDASFIAINRMVLRHTAIRGNVETELAASDTAAGCGCGYPDYVSDADVARSNEIMAQLAKTAKRHPSLTSRLGALPMNTVAKVGDVRVGIVHGDADSLAGWTYGEEAIDSELVRKMFDAAQVRVFASSHTCAAVAQVFDTPSGPSVLLNNGAAGMPNFAGSTFGVITRISTRAAPPGIRTLYGTEVSGLAVDAIALEYDHRGWVSMFDHLWPTGTPASLSYRARIVDGPAYSLQRAARNGMELKTELPTESLA